MRWFEAMTRRREPADRPVGPARAGGGPGPRAPRIALYSHDTQGLGHIRRNLLISRAFCRNGATPVILLLSFQCKQLYKVVNSLKIQDLQLHNLEA